jgi:hypothetical protein
MFQDLIPTLQIAIGPVILISGVGLLLLSMTNRLGRIVDRTRAVALALRTRTADPAVLDAQLDVLSRRATVMRRSIRMAVVSVLCAAALVITLFLAALLHRDAGVLVVALFIACMGALILALISFLRDINLSLTALTLEVQDSRNHAGK